MIRFETVSKQFGDDTFALKQVSFEVAPGDFVLLTGPSGSGKTTIMRLLTKEYIPTEGEIYFENQALSEIKKSQIHLHRRKIGVVFQDYKLLPELNVWENIALALNILGKGQDEIESRVSDLLRLVNLVDKAFLFPNQLSGGEAQRVSIARALATGPSVIFADEPTGNLDSETSLQIARLFKKINELGTTVLIATHDTGVLEALPHAHLLHLERGSLTKDSGSNSEKKPKHHKDHHAAKHEPEHVHTTPLVDENDKPLEKKAEPEPEKAESKAPRKFGWPFGKKHDTAKDEHPSMLDDSKNSSEGDDLHSNHEEKVKVKVEKL
jgi:cell division transport system ATP-binding protein